MDIYPYLLEEFHNWHKTLGFERSPISSFLIFGGKGGVGKSTLACAVAIKLSEKGKTLVVSLDPAHSLSGIFLLDVGKEPTHLFGNLWAVELDAHSLSKEYTKRVFESIKTLLSPKAQEAFFKMADVVSQSNTSLETAAFNKIVEFFQEYEYVVLDFAPTGNMIRFFSSIDLLEEWMNLLISLAKRQEHVERFMGREYPLVNLLQERLEKVKSFKQVLKEKSVIYAIANEEPLSMEEAQFIEERFNGLRVYTVINKCVKESNTFLKVPFKENLYGVEALKSLDVSQLLSIL